MPLTNYASAVVRPSAITSGTSEMDERIILPEQVSSIFLYVEKTAEADPDNLLTVRLQCKTELSTFVDVPYVWLQETADLTAAADVETNVTRTPNVFDGPAGDQPATMSRLAYYDRLPNGASVRTIWIASGTAPAITWSATAYFELYDNV